MRGQPGTQDSDQRRSDDDPERVGGDHVTGLRDGHPTSVGHLRQQAHRHELGGADGEAADGEREGGDGHPSREERAGPDGVDGADGRTSGSSVVVVTRVPSAQRGQGRLRRTQPFRGNDHVVASIPLSATETPPLSAASHPPTGAGSGPGRGPLTLPGPRSRLAAGRTHGGVMLSRDHWQRHVARLDPETDFEEIYRIVVAHEFPWDMNQALSFALFRTYAVPSIGRLLDETGEFARDTQKRYDDTALLLDEPVQRTACTATAAGRAIRRINQMHGSYDIAHDDLRYVLTTFVVVPMRWLDGYGWRRLSAGEVRATVLLLPRARPAHGDQGRAGDLRRVRGAARRLRGRALRLRRGRPPGRRRDAGADAHLLPLAARPADGAVQPVPDGPAAARGVPLRPHPAVVVRAAGPGCGCGAGPRRCCRPGAGRGTAPTPPGSGPTPTDTGSRSSARSPAAARSRTGRTGTTA